jgi:hypothetical protein
MPRTGMSDCVNLFLSFSLSLLSLYPRLAPCYFQYSSPGVAELADAADSKSPEQYQNHRKYRYLSGPACETQGLVMPTVAPTARFCLKPETIKYIITVTLKGGVNMSNEELSRAASILGRKGGKISGKVRSAAKAAASRENGKLGGRPRKAEVKQ